MTYASLKYSLKVWLTSVVAAPALFILTLSLAGYMDTREMFREGIGGFSFYFMLVAFSFIFSLATWLTFLLVIVAIRHYCKQEYLMKWLIFFFGIALTAGSFILVLGFYEIFHDGFGFLMGANCACIGWGVWVYKLEAKGSGQISAHGNQAFS